MMVPVSTRLSGYCPMGCGPTLTVDPAGEARCAMTGCPRPRAAAELLDDQEAEHVVTLAADGFTLRHPLRERLDDALLDCNLHLMLAKEAPADLAPGRYRVSVCGSTWTWERVA